VSSSTEGRGYAVKKDTVISIQQPTTARDALTDVLREGAQKLLAEAVQAEVGTFLEEYQGLRDERGHQRVVRKGYLPEREIQTGLGGIKRRVPRTRDRDPGKEPEQAIRFRSSLVPPYLRRSKSVEELLPILNLKGISTGEFREALSALLGLETPRLSAKTISRL
jgi:transposase-like protein